MNVLVVGGAGYVGSVVVEELVRARESAIVLDDLSTGHRDAVSPLAYFVRGSIGDEGPLQEAFETKSIDCVIHLAGKSLVAESVAHPERYEEANVAQGRLLLDAMRAHGVTDIVFSSTAAVYDPSAPMPLHESSPLRPENPYGETKLRFERTLAEHAARGEARFVSLRYFNVAGASIDHGEDHREETHLIPLLLDAAREARGPVPVYGDDYPTPDGTAVRDYVHVVDVAEAHRRAARYLADGGESRAFNLGSGRGSSVREVVAAVESVTGRRVPTRRAERRPGDPPALIASSDEARRVLGWKPQFGDLGAIVETAWDWRMRHPEGYRE
ncbi:MAG: UDP-glucose 4-epimerase GalE [Candidatus Latescibacteria bacterium]|nr:UDP-glucose 4-epimerase GalE [Candidatus Latescibacterota bacterium]